MWHMTGYRVGASSDVSTLQPLPRPFGRGQLFTKKLQWTLSPSVHIGLRLGNRGLPRL